MKFFLEMPLSFTGSGQGIECGLVRSVNAVMEHVHSLHCDSRQPVSFSMSLLKAAALESTSRVKQGTGSQFTFCYLICEKYSHRTIGSSRKGPSNHPEFNHPPSTATASPKPQSLPSAPGAAGYEQEVEPHLEVDVFTLFPPPCFHLAAPGSGCLVQKLSPAP